MLKRQERQQEEMSTTLSIEIQRGVVLEMEGGRRKE